MIKRLAALLLSILTVLAGAMIAVDHPERPFRDEREKK